MKKTILKKISPIILTLLLLAGLGAGFPIKSYAAGVSVYPSSDTVYVGDSVTVTVTIYGDEIYAYSGSVGCDGNLSGFTGGFADGADGGGAVSFSYTYYAVGEGTAAVYVSGCEVSDGLNKDYAGDAACYINVIGYDNGGGGTGGNAGGQRAISMSSVMTTAVVVPVEMPEAAGMIPARSTALRSEKGPIIQTLQLWKWRDTP